MFCGQYFVSDSFFIRLQPFSLFPYTLWFPSPGHLILMLGHLSCRITCFLNQSGLLGVSLQWHPKIFSVLAFCFPSIINNMLLILPISLFRLCWIKWQNSVIGSNIHSCYLILVGIFIAILLFYSPF